MIAIERPVFVFSLDRNNRSTTGRLQRRKLFPKPLQPRTHGRYMFRIAAAKRAVVFEHPCGISAQFPLSTNVGPGPQNHIQPLLLRLADKLSNIVISGKIVSAFRRLMKVPENIGCDRVSPMAFAIRRRSRQ